MKVLEGKNYRQWQSRNTSHFNSLTKKQQKEIRNQGYCNIGWDKVQNSWEIICKSNRNIASLFEHKLKKGNVIGAIELLLVDAGDTKKIAQEAVNSLAANQKRFKKIGNEALAKYPAL
jgi:hypothetical protein